MAEADTISKALFSRFVNRKTLLEKILHYICFLVIPIIVDIIVVCTIVYLSIYLFHLFVLLKPGSFDFRTWDEYFRMTVYMTVVGRSLFILSIKPDEYRRKIERGYT